MLPQKKMVFLELLRDSSVRHTNIHSFADGAFSTLFHIRPTNLLPDKFLVVQKSSAPDMMHPRSLTIFLLSV